MQADIASGSLSSTRAPVPEEEAALAELRRNCREGAEAQRVAKQEEISARIRREDRRRANQSAGSWSTCLPTHLKGLGEEAATTRVATTRLTPSTPPSSTTITSTCRQRRAARVDRSLHRHLVLRHQVRSA